MLFQVSHFTSLQASGGKYVPRGVLVDLVSKLRETIF